MSVELPARAFFRYRVPLSRRPARLRVDGSLGEWDDATLLPDLRAMFARLPLAEAIRASRPDAHVTWVVEAPFMPLVDGHPAVDLVIPTRSKGGFWMVWIRPARSSEFMS